MPFRRSSPDKDRPSHFNNHVAKSLVDGTCESQQSDLFADAEAKGRAQPPDGFEFYISMAVKPFFLAIHFVRHHIELTVSGETPRLEIEFSPMVAVSSLVYLPVALAFWVNGALFMGATMSLVTITSLMSDSVDPSSKFWNRADRFLCTMGAILGPVKAIALAADVGIKLQVVLACCISLAFLAWSRQSINQDQFSLRHTCWHLVSSAALTWLAFSVPIGP